MRKIMMICLTFCLGAGLLGATVEAQVQINVFPPPLPVTVAPVWTPVPGVGGVFYAPNLGIDVFRYGGGYYYYYNGGWFRSGVFGGPWVAIGGPPKVFYGMPAPFFRTPPGWARGQKTGWHGGPVPPGQFKRTIPPGPGEGFEGEHGREPWGGGEFPGGHGRGR